MCVSRVEEAQAQNEAPSAINRWPILAFSLHISFPVVYSVFFLLCMALCVSLSLPLFLIIPSSHHLSIRFRSHFCFMFLVFALFQKERIIKMRQTQRMCALSMPRGQSFGHGQPECYVQYIIRSRWCRQPNPYAVECRNVTPALVKYQKCRRKYHHCCNRRSRARTRPSSDTTEGVLISPTGN